MSTRWIQRLCLGALLSLALGAGAAWFLVFRYPTTALLDVPDKWKRSRVEGAIAYGLVEPSWTRRFRPDSSLTAREFRQWLARATGSLPPASGDAGDGEDITHRKAVQELGAALHRFEGIPGLSLNSSPESDPFEIAERWGFLSDPYLFSYTPDAPLTRIQAVPMMQRLYVIAQAKYRHVGRSAVVLGDTAQVSFRLESYAAIASEYLNGPFSEDFLKLTKHRAVPIILVLGDEGNAKRWRLADNSLGHYSPYLGVVVLSAWSQPGNINRILLAHELTHWVVGEVYRSELSRWMSEGIAVLESFRAVEGWSDGWSVAAAQEWLLLYESTDPIELQEDSSRLWRSAAVHYLLATRGGIAAVERYLQTMVRDGPDVAFHNVFGETTETFLDRFRTEVRALRNRPDRGAEITIQVNTPGWLELIPPNSKMVQATPFTTPGTRRYQVHPEGPPTSVNPELEIPFPLMGVKVEPRYGLVGAWRFVPDVDRKRYTVVTVYRTGGGHYLAATETFSQSHFLPGSQHVSVTIQGDQPWLGQQMTHADSEG